ncbi:MAG: sensor histidine kinase [Bacteroidota bacterium]
MLIANIVGSYMHMKSERKSTITSIGKHIGVWLAIMLSISTLVYAFGDKRDEGFVIIFLQAVTGFGIALVPTIYFNTHLLIPKLLDRKRYVWYVVGVVVFALIWGPIALYLERWADQNFFFDYSDPDEGPLPGVFVIALVLVMTTLINLSYKWFLQQNKITRIENDRLNIELSMLRSQINPHFFFNTLNNLYSLALEQSERTPEVILKLSEMMRYTIYDCKAAEVAIRHEVKYLENYISLQQIRLQGRGDVSFTHAVEDDELKVAPMLFIVLLENAFKHGIEKMTEQAYIRMHLKTDGKQLVFCVENNHESISGEGTFEGKLGLENVRRRLDLIYPERHKLELHDEKGVYKAKMTIEAN